MFYPNKEYTVFQNNYPLAFPFFPSLCSINVGLSHLEVIWFHIKEMSDTELAKYSLKKNTPTKI